MFDYRESIKWICYLPIPSLSTVKPWISRRPTSTEAVEVTVAFSKGREQIKRDPVGLA